MKTVLYRALQHEFKNSFHQLAAYAYPTLFFLLILILLSFDSHKTAYFILTHHIWIAVLLASLITTEHIFLQEQKSHYFDYLLLSAEPILFFIYAKYAVQYILFVFPITISIILISLFVQIPIDQFYILILGMSIASWIFIGMSMLLSALSSQLESAGAWLGLILLPFMFPVLLLCFSLTQSYFIGIDRAAILLFLTGVGLLSILFFPIMTLACLRLGASK